jgi:hypothetical protein
MSDKKKLVIKWNQDDHDCETCGGSYAVGAEVTLDGEVIVNKQAVAACYDGSGDVDMEGILAIALEKLGVEIIQASDGGGYDYDLEYAKNMCYEWHYEEDGEGSHNIVYDKI